MNMNIKNRILVLIVLIQVIVVMIKMNIIKTTQNKFPYLCHIKKDICTKIMIIIVKLSVTIWFNQGFDVWQEIQGKNNPDISQIKIWIYLGMALFFLFTLLVMWHAWKMFMLTVIWNLTSHLHLDSRFRMFLFNIRMKHFDNEPMEKLVFRTGLSLAFTMIICYIIIYITPRLFK